MSKESLVTNGILLAGAGFVLYFGYRAVSSLLSGGNLGLGGILGFGGGAGKTDIFGNTTVAETERNLQAAYTSVAESNAYLADAEAKIDLYTYDPAYEELYRIYIKETREYNDLLAAFKPTYGFWTGKEDPETVAYRRQLEKERAEAVVAGDNVSDWMAKHT